MKVAVIVLALLLAMFGLVTWWALESDGVAVIGTRSQDGTLRSTHVWFAEADGEFWLEAGTPDSPWLADVREDSTVLFSADRRSGRYAAQLVVGPSGHAKIRSLFREKYGIRDWWVGLLVDSSGSLAVHLSPRESP